MTCNKMKSNRRRFNVFLNFRRSERSGPYDTGRDGTKWFVYKNGKKVGKTRPPDIVTQLPGVKAVAKEVKAVVDCFFLQ